MIELKLIPTSIAVERRKIVVEYYRKMRAQLGLSEKVRQSSDKNYPDEQNVLFAHYIETPKDKEREFFYVTWQRTVFWEAVPSISCRKPTIRSARA